MERGKKLSRAPRAHGEGLIAQSEAAHGIRLYTDLLELPILRVSATGSAEGTDFWSRSGGKVRNSIEKCVLLRYYAHTNTVDRKNSKITVILPAEEFDRFDSYCQEQGFKKSTLIARLIRDHLGSVAHRLQRDLPIRIAAENHSKS